MRSRLYTTLLVLFITSYHCVAQETQVTNKPFLSSEAFFIYPYYHSNYENQFNYGMGLTLTENFKSFNVTSGFFYTTKNYYERPNDNSNVDKITYSLNYLNIPLFVSFPVTKEFKNHSLFLLNTGLILNIPSNYSSTIYYKNNASPTANNTASKYVNGSSLRLGLQYRKELTKHLSLFAEIYADYKFKLDYIDLNASGPHPGPTYNSYTGDEVTTGIFLGARWSFKQ